MYSRALERRRLESGAGDGNRTHGSSLGSLGITIIRRPRRWGILVAFRVIKQICRTGVSKAPEKAPFLHLTNYKVQKNL
jgi:hypothetical protein